MFWLLVIIAVLLLVFIRSDKEARGCLLVILALLLIGFMVTLY